MLSDHGPDSAECHLTGRIRGIDPACAARARSWTDVEQHGARVDGARVARRVPRIGGGPGRARDGRAAAGPRDLRLFPDTYVRRTGTPPDLALRSYAAHLYSARRGIVSGYSAALLLGGLRVHRDRVHRDGFQICSGVPVTTARRTAFDLARSGDLVEAVVALDALARCGGFAPRDVLATAARYPRARGSARLPRVVDLADARSGSPMESRLRMVLVLRGLPTPEVQFPVLDDRRRRAVWRDTAYPQARIGIEYEGAEHVPAERVLRDVGRYTRLVDGGWRIHRLTKIEVYGEPDEIAAEIRRALAG